MWSRIRRRCATLLGKSIAVAFSNSRSPREYEFATDRYLWWAFADPEVVWLGTDDKARGARMRKTLDGWRKTDITGKPLRSDGLSTIRELGKGQLPHAASCHS